MKYAIIVIALFFTACSRPAKTNQTDQDNPYAQKIKINLFDTSKKYIEDIADTMSVVTLSASHYFNFSGATNFFFLDNAIILADRMQGIVFIFNKKGQLINTINSSVDKKKMSDGRFTYISDAFYDEDEKLIEILDRTADRVFRFTPDGAIKDTLKLADARAWGYDFVKAKDIYVTKLLNSNQDKKGVGIYKKDENVLRYNAEALSVIPSTQKLNFVQLHQLDVYKDSVFFFPMLADKIYHITGSGAKPAYLLDYPAQYRLDSDIKNAEPTKDPYNFFRKLANANVIYSNNSLFINDQWVSFRFNFQTKTSPRNVFYNKESKKVLQFSELLSKTRKTPFPQAYVIGKYKDYFVMLNDAPVKKSKDPKVLPVGNYKLLFFKLKNI
ncbi:MAG: hypothetical protein JWQ34_3305 [Mucilaginibacter sp.]|uniref:6-bladed beta-propeller n=1 Tax=Mucilaginibacter sp. TaxID=1882438 RepID=UPI002638A83D|nr:6-bladed beta-propeller [Mucilaginibacter sp.]MDB5005080.1 hypothetical protein [Mucilaginibacter sp.]